MPTTQFFLPEKIKVGFDKRDNTYTGKLAYVIYYDKSGVLKKEKSWEGWRDKTIAPQEFDNVPTEGFVLNKGVGGQRHSYGWNARNEYIRVYDPRDFEIEISVANLLFILRENDCSKGKGLEGKFVYAWDKQSLVLLPVNSADYQDCQKFTEIHGKKIKKNELKPGCTYITSNIREVIYLGRFDYHTPVYVKTAPSVSKMHVFWDLNNHKLECTNKFTHLAQLVSETPHPDFADLVDKYHKSPWGSRPVRLFTEERPAKKDRDYWWGYRSENQWATPQNDGSFLQCLNNHNYQNPEKIDDVAICRKCYILDGKLVCEGMNNLRAYRPNEVPEMYKKNALNNIQLYRGYHLHEWIEPTNDRLFVELESGSRFRVYDYQIKEEE